MGTLKTTLTGERNPKHAEHTHLLFLDWNRISSTVALREPDSSSFNTSLQRPQLGQDSKHGAFLNTNNYSRFHSVTMSSRSLPPSAWLFLVLRPLCHTKGSGDGLGLNCVMKRRLIRKPRYLRINNIDLTTRPVKSNL